MSEARLAGRLRRAKLRSTFARLKVLEMLSENPGFRRSEDIYLWLFDHNTPVKLGSVYRVLREMHAVGLVLCLRDASSVRYCFKPESATPTLRLVCRDGGERLVFSDLELYAQILAVAAREGLKLEGREFDLQARSERRSADSAGPAGRAGWRIAENFRISA